MPILFQSRNVRRLLGMYITKQAEQEIYLIAQQYQCHKVVCGYRNYCMRIESRQIFDIVYIALSLSLSFSHSLFLFFLS